MTNEHLHNLFTDVIKDLYSAEDLIVEKGLPAMISAAKNEDLKNAFEEHLDQSKEHRSRLETICKDLDIPTGGKKCLAMEGIIAEGEELIGMDFGNGAGDFALITAAQKVEHYEMASYSTAVMLGELMEHDDAVDLLDKTLDEEVEASQKLDEVVESLLMEMEESSDDMMDDEDDDMEE